MNKILTTAAVLVALIAPAHAANTLPAEFVGSWCPVANTSDEYIRCSSNSELTIRKNSYEGLEMACKLFKLVNRGRGDYLAHFRCSSDEGNHRTTWFESYWMSVSGQKLYMKKM